MFLKDLALKAGLGRVHIIAHSMGNQGLLRAAQGLAPELRDAGVTLGQIILAAPDVDVATFERLANVYPDLSERTTMYASHRDRALRISRWLQDSDRAGFFPLSPQYLASTQLRCPISMSPDSILDTASTPRVKHCSMTSVRC